MTDSQDTATDPNNATLLAIVLAVLTALAVTAAVLVLSANPAPRAAPSQSETAETLQIVGAWVAQPIGQQSATAAYFTVRNDSEAGDTLIGGSSLVAGGGELHATVFDGGVMRMRPVRGIPVPSLGAMSLEPGGFHMMLTDLQQPLVAGQTVRLILEFEKAGAIVVEAPVRDRTRPGMFEGEMDSPAGGHEGHGDHDGHGGETDPAPAEETDPLSEEDGGEPA